MEFDFRSFSSWGDIPNTVYGNTFRIFKWERNGYLLCKVFNKVPILKMRKTTILWPLNVENGGIGAVDGRAIYWPRRLNPKCHQAELKWRIWTVSFWGAGRHGNRLPCLHSAFPRFRLSLLREDSCVPLLIDTFTFTRWVPSIMCIWVQAIKFIDIWKRDQSLINNWLIWIGLKAQLSIILECQLEWFMSSCSRH